MGSLPSREDPPVSREPFYARIVADIRRQIEAGDLRPGDQIPTMAQLREQYGVSITVVRAALLTLRAEGLIEGQQGKGIYVRDPAAG